MSQSCKNRLITRLSPMQRSAAMSDQIRSHHISSSHTRLFKCLDLDGFNLRAHVDMETIMLKPCMDFTADH